MSRFRIRRPEEKDAEALAQLSFYMWNEFYKNCVPKSYSKQNYTLEQCRQYQLEMLDAIQLPDKALALIAEDIETGKIAALSYINQNDQIEDNDLYVPGFELEFQHMYIWPEYRHKNLGGKLFYKMMQWAKQNNYNSIYWWVIDLNPYSAIHAKHGAIIVKQMPRDYTGTSLDLTAYGFEI